MTILAPRDRSVDAALRPLLERVLRSGHTLLHASVSVMDTIGRAHIEAGKRSLAGVLGDECVYPDAAMRSVQVCINEQPPIR